jgi:hypothetical protein
VGARRSAMSAGFPALDGRHQRLGPPTRTDARSRERDGAAGH